MKALIRMTGPHTARTWREGRPVQTWHVGIVDSAAKAQPTVYKCLSYRRAVFLSCNMARDRRLFLHMEALPH